MIWMRKSFLLTKGESKTGNCRLSIRPHGNNDYSVFMAMLSAFLMLRTRQRAMPCPCSSSLSNSTATTRWLDHLWPKMRQLVPSRRHLKYWANGIQTGRLLLSWLTTPYRRYKPSRNCSLVSQDKSLFWVQKKSRYSWRKFSNELKALTFTGKNTNFSKEKSWSGELLQLFLNFCIKT